MLLERRRLIVDTFRSRPIPYSRNEPVGDSSASRKYPRRVSLKVPIEKLLSARRHAFKRTNAK